MYVVVNTTNKKSEVNNMGRRIYEVNGDFVWKYSFGRQASEMSRFSEEFEIGEYQRSEMPEDTPEEYMEEYNWTADRTTDLPKLKELYTTIMNGHTEKQINIIGMDAIRNFVKEQNDKWREVFKDEIDGIESGKITSMNDFEYYACGKSGESFNPYDIYALAIEKIITDSYDFLRMINAFINYIETHNKEEYCFIDEL